MKNSKVKAILSAILALSIASAMAMPVFAAPAASGSGSVVFTEGATGPIDPENPPVVPPLPDKYLPYLLTNALDFGTSNTLIIDQSFVEKDGKKAGLVFGNPNVKNYELYVAIDQFKTVADSTPTMAAASLTLTAGTEAHDSGTVTLITKTVPTDSTPVAIANTTAPLTGMNFTPVLNVKAGTTVVGKAATVMTWTSAIV